MAVHPSLSFPFQRAADNNRLRASIPPAHKINAYRCYLPVLTGLGTILLRRTWSININYCCYCKGGVGLGWEFDPARADCRKQGTANSPSSTASVEPMGVEPTTFALRTRRSPNWATAPIFYWILSIDDWIMKCYRLFSPAINNQSTIFNIQLKSGEAGIRTLGGQRPQRFSRPSR